jgi:hypothetical protein
MPRKASDNQYEMKLKTKRVRYYKSASIPSCAPLYLKVKQTPKYIHRFFYLPLRKKVSNAINTIAKELINIIVSLRLLNTL